MPYPVPNIMSHRRRRSTHRPRVSRIPWVLITAIAGFAAGIAIAAVADPVGKACLAVAATGYLAALAIHAIATRYTNTDSEVDA